MPPRASRSSQLQTRGERYESPSSLLSSSPQHHHQLNQSAESRPLTSSPLSCRSILLSATRFFLLLMHLHHNGEQSRDAGVGGQETRRRARGRSCLSADHPQPTRDRANHHGVESQLHSREERERKYKLHKERRRGKRIRKL